MPATSPPRAWAEIDLGAIRHNLNVVKQADKGEYYMARGEGVRLRPRSGTSLPGTGRGGDRLLRRRERGGGTAHQPGGLAARGRTSWGPSFPEEREEIVLNGWRSFISTMEEAVHYNSLARLYGKTLPIHISVDTGMGRGGFLPDQLEELLSRLGELDSLYMEGLGAHLPCADEDRETTLEQIACFERMAARIRERLPLEFCHLANSAASLDYDIPSNNLCRPGLVLYGFSPIPSPWEAQLKPAMSLFSRLTVARTLPAGHGISYGGTFVTDHPTKVATVGIGYADGYLRSLAHKGARVMVEGISCPLLGRVTMDQIMVDVSRVPSPEPGMTVEIMGPNIPVTELAEKAGTISWEIFTGIGPRVPRHYTH